ncbi:TetR/AcrR family transcriptional regulator [Ralstonia pseudosolanacearum]|uniref:TetR/AcrR family transcriptional regulator n=1 Tax=Ralstonia pseudosolanacearum TaxID=1310165 RepID=UPI00366F797F
MAARAGVTRGAVYGHFPGKPALVAAIIDGLLWPPGYRRRPRGLSGASAAAAAVARPAVRPVDAVLANPGATACRDARASGVRLPGVPGGGG